MLDEIFSCHIMGNPTAFLKYSQKLVTSKTKEILTKESKSIPLEVTFILQSVGVCLFLKFAFIRVKFAKYQIFRWEMWELLSLY